LVIAKAQLPEGWFWNRIEKIKDKWIIEARKINSDNMIEIAVARGRFFNDTLFTILMEKINSGNVQEIDDEEPRW